MSKRNVKNKKIQKTIAHSRIHKLCLLAENYALSGRVHLANRYVDLARKLSMRYLVPIPTEYKRRICKHCYHYLLPSSSCRVRIHRGKLIMYCYACQKYTRIPLKHKETPSARLK